MSQPSIFLKLDFGGTPIVGEATMRGFEEQIVIDSFSWEVSATHKPVADDKVNTEWRPQTIKLSKFFDRASTALYLRMKERKKFTKATVTVVDVSLPNERPSAMLKFEIDDGHIETIQTKASESGSFMKISEDLTLSFTGGSLSYTVPAASGSRRTLPTFNFPKVKTGS